MFVSEESAPEGVNAVTLSYAWFLIAGRLKVK